MRYYTKILLIIHSAIVKKMVEKKLKELKRSRFHAVPSYYYYNSILQKGSPSDPKIPMVDG